MAGRKKHYSNKDNKRGNMKRMSPSSVAGAFLKDLTGPVREAASVVHSLYKGDSASTAMKKLRK